MLVYRVVETALCGQTIDEYEPNGVREKEFAAPGRRIEEPQP